MRLGGLLVVTITAAGAGYMALDLLMPHPGRPQAALGTNAPRHPPSTPGSPCLPPIASDEVILVTANVPDAHLFDDGKDLGRLPLNVGRPHRADYTMLVRAEGYVGHGIVLTPQSPARVMVRMVSWQSLVTQASAASRAPMAPRAPSRSRHPSVRPPQGGSPNQKATTTPLTIVSDDRSAPDAPWIPALPTK